MIFRDRKVTGIWVARVNCRFAWYRSIEFRYIVLEAFFPAPPGLPDTLCWHWSKPSDVHTTLDVNVNTFGHKLFTPAVLTYHPQSEWYRLNVDFASKLFLLSRESYDRTRLLLDYPSRQSGCHSPSETFCTGGSCRKGFDPLRLHLPPSSRVWARCTASRRTDG